MVGRNFRSGGEERCVGRRFSSLFVGVGAWFTRSLVRRWEEKGVMRIVAMRCSICRDLLGRRREEELGGGRRVRVLGNFRINEFYEGRVYY